MSALIKILTIHFQILSSLGSFDLKLADSINSSYSFVGQPI